MVNDVQEEEVVRIDFGGWVSILRGRGGTGSIGTLLEVEVDPERSLDTLDERLRVSIPVDLCLRGLARGNAGLGSLLL